MKLLSLSGGRGPIRFLDQPFDRCCAVVGPNASGKTTLLELIEFGVHGLSRDQGGPVEKWVDLRFDGMTVNRRVELDKEGKTVHTVEVHARGQQPTSKVREAEQTIAFALGTAWAWDARSVLASTPPERRKAIAGLLGASLTVSVVAAQLKAAGVGMSDLPEEAQPHVKGRLADLLRKKDSDGAEFAQSWLALVREAKNLVQRDTENARAAVATASQRVESAGALPGASAAWQIELDQLREREVQIRARLEARTRAVQARATIQRALDDARTDYERAKAVAEGVEVDGAEKVLARARDQRGQVETAMGKLEIDLAAAKVREAETAEAERAGLPEIEQLTRVDGFREAVEVLRPLLAPILTWVLRIDGPDTGPSAVPDFVAEPAMDLHRVLDADTAADDIRLQQLRDQQRAAAGIAMAAHRVTQRLQDDLDVMRLKPNPVPMAEQVLRQQQAKQADARASLDRQAQLVEQMTANLADLPTPDDSADRVALEGVQAEMATATATLRAIQDYDAIIADRDRCVVRSNRMSSVRNDLHEFEKEAERVVAALYVEAVRPLVEPASLITDFVLGRPLRIVPDEQWNIALGPTRIEHCSESQTMIAAIALHAAVQSLQDRSWKAVVVDGTEAIDEHHRTRLVHALWSNPGIDNTILASVDDGFDPLVKEAQVIGLGTSRVPSRRIG